VLLTGVDGAPAPLPLTGVRVIDLSTIGPGPFCAALLGDLGADVIAVERAQTGQARVQSSAAELRGANPWLRDARRRTRRIGLELKRPEGREVLHRLVAGADVVIEGFRPGVTTRLGADYKTLAAFNERLVYCSISGYGQTGPHRDRPGHDINYIAEAGLLGLTGHADGTPTLPGALIADFAAGSLYAASGILAAVAGREQTKKGCHIDVSMHEAVVQVMARFIVPYLESGHVYQRGGSYLLGANAWYNAHRTSDDAYVAVGAVEDKFLEQLASLLGHPEWAALRGDPAGEETLSAELPAALVTHSRQELVELLGDDACVSPVATIAEVADNPQLVHRGVFSTSDHDARLGAMARGADSRVDHRPVSDENGRHTECILTEAGYGAAAQRELRLSGAIG
jgi:alpha-methylacyl-CoA racemase